MYAEKIGGRKWEAVFSKSLCFIVPIDHQPRIVADFERKCLFIVILVIYCVVRMLYVILVICCVVRMLYVILLYTVS